MYYKPKYDGTNTLATCQYKMNTAGVLPLVLSVYPRLLPQLPFSSINRCLLLSHEINRTMKNMGESILFSPASFHLTIQEISERCQDDTVAQTNVRLKRSMQFFFAKGWDADIMCQDLGGLLRSGTPWILLSTYLRAVKLGADDPFLFCELSLVQNCILHDRHDFLKYILQNFDIDVRCLLQFTCENMDSIRPSQQSFEILIHHLPFEGYPFSLYPGATFLCWSRIRLETFAHHIANNLEMFENAAPALAVLDTWERGHVQNIISDRLDIVAKEKQLVVETLAKDLKAIDRSIQCKLIHKKNRDSALNRKKITTIGKSRTSRRTNQAHKELARLDRLICTFTQFINK